MNLGAVKAFHFNDLGTWSLDFELLCYHFFLENKKKRKVESLNLKVVLN